MAQPAPPQQPGPGFLRFGLFTLGAAYTFNTAANAYDAWITEGVTTEDKSDPLVFAGEDAEASWSSKYPHEEPEPGIIKRALDYASGVPQYFFPATPMDIPSGAGQKDDSEIPQAPKEPTSEAPVDRDAKFPFLGLTPTIGVPYLDAYLIAYRAINLNVSEFVGLHDNLPDLALTRKYYRRQAYILHQLGKPDELKKANIALSLIEALLGVAVEQNGLPAQPSIFFQDGIPLKVFVSPSVLIWAIKNPGAAKLHFDEIVKTSSPTQPIESSLQDKIYLPLGLLLGATGIAYVFVGSRSRR